MPFDDVIMKRRVLTCNKPAHQEHAHNAIDRGRLTWDIRFLAHMSHDPADERAETLKEEKHAEHEDIYGDVAFPRAAVEICGTWRKREFRLTRGCIWGCSVPGDSCGDMWHLEKEGDSVNTMMYMGM